MQGPERPGKPRLNAMSPLKEYHRHALGAVESGVQVLRGETVPIASRPRVQPSCRSSKSDDCYCRLPKSPAVLRHMECTWFALF